MKNLKSFFLMAVLMLTATTMFTSCSNEEIIEDLIGVDEYYMVLDEVHTNLVDENGKTLTQALYDAFVSENGKSQSLGKSTAAPLDAFEKSCKNFESALQTALSGNLPQNGYISYKFSLRKDSPTGRIQMQKTVTIR